LRFVIPPRFRNPIAGQRILEWNGPTPSANIDFADRKAGGKYAPQQLQIRWARSSRHWPLRRKCPRNSADGDEHARKPVPQRRKFVPTKKKNAQKNRFGEEGKTFQRKRIPMMPPALAIKLGQSKPSSKERTVPEIAHWLNPVAHAGGNV